MSAKCQKRTFSKPANCALCFCVHAPTSFVLMVFTRKSLVHRHSSGVSDVLVRGPSPSELRGQLNGCRIQ